MIVAGEVHFPEFRSREFIEDLQPRGCGAQVVRHDREVLRFNSRNGSKFALRLLPVSGPKSRATM